MKIYYEAKALERAVDSAPRITPSTKSVLKKIIRSAPVADAEPLTHGRWVPFHSQAAGDIQYCSACEIGFAARMNYCPNCGARMDAPSNLAELEDAERSRRIESLLKKGVTGW